MTCEQAGMTCTKLQQEQLQDVLSVVNEDIKKKQEKLNQDTYVDGKKVMTAEDVNKAYGHAHSKMCDDQSYTFIPNKDGGVCAHTYETCMRDSEETGNDYDMKYLEWRGSKDGLNKCVYAFSGYKERCEENALTYDKTKGQCKTNKKYCECKGVEYKDGDCWRDPVSKAFGTVFGNTVTQGFNRELFFKGSTHGCTAFNDDVFVAVATGGVGLATRKAIQAAKGKDTSFKTGKSTSVLKGKSELQKRREKEKSEEK